MIKIGTSGFSYKDWEGKFYPEDLPDKDKLEYYTKHFDTVELNNTFYQLPSKETFENWRERTPDGFLFTVKVSRFITHRKYLKDCSEAWKKFYNRAEALKEKLGPLLIQLPARWNVNLERIENFVANLKETSPNEIFAFEFRNESWFEESIIEFFKEQENITLCLADSSKWYSFEGITGDFVFIRFHGPGKVYESKYSREELKQWTEKINDYKEQGLDVYCYFNNDFDGYAIKNAAKLTDLIKD